MSTVVHLKTEIQATQLASTMIINEQTAAFSPISTLDFLARDWTLPLKNSLTRLRWPLPSTRKTGHTQDSPTSFTPHIPARLVKLRMETHDTKSYFFEGKWPLRSYQAGQHINIQFATDFETVNRTYTLSSSPKQCDRFSITVKRVAGGLASNWMFDNLTVGDTILVSQPQGQFVLPIQPAGRLLMISAGSGVTPLMSMLRYLSQTGNRSEITFLHYAQSADDLIFGDELKQLAKQHAHIALHFSVEKEPFGTDLNIGRISKAQLLRLVPDVLQQEIYLCGPPPFMQATLTLLDELGFNSAHLHQENFSADLSAAKRLHPTYSAQLTFLNSGARTQSEPARTILEAAESKGLKPASACRMGICKTCRCKKVSGTTVNLVTGEESTQDNDYILPCVSVAKSDTAIAL